MTSIKPIFTLFLLFSSLFCSATETDLIQKIEANLNLRNQDLVIQLSRQLETKGASPALAHFYLANGYLLLGKDGIVQYDSSLYFISKVLKETKATDDLHFKADLFMTHVFLEMGNYKECVRNIQQLMRTKEVSKSPSKQFVLTIELLNLYTRISDLKSAREYLDLIKNLPSGIDSFDLAKSYMATGRYYLSEGNLPFAKIAFTKALHSCEKKSICYKVDAWHMLAEVEKEQNNVDGAMEIYKDLLQYEEKNNYQHGFIHTLLIACETSISENRNKWEMSDYVSKAYQYALKLNNKLRLVQAEMNMGYYNQQLNNNNEATIHFSNALKIAKEIKADYWSRSASRFLVEIYKQKGDYQNAFVFQQEFIDANEKLQESNQTQKADLVRNVHLMYTYRHEMEESAYALEKKQVYLIISITIAIATLGISVLLFLLYLKQKRHNLFLTEKALKETKRKIELIQPVNVPEKEEVSEEKTEQRQSLDDSIYLDLQQKLLVFIEQKGFLDPDCSLSALAKEFNTNTAYLSKYINEILNTSFNQLINEYRILDFIERVKVDKEGRKTFTLDHLASLSGFSSKSTFIRAFKKQTGLAPSVFLKNLEELG